MPKRTPKPKRTPRRRDDGREAPPPLISTVTGRHHPQDRRLTVFVSWPYSPSHALFTEVVKDALPRGTRRFDSGAPGQPRGWWIAPAVRDRMFELLLERFLKVRLVTEQGDVTIGPGGDVIEEEAQARLL